MRVFILIFDISFKMMKSVLIKDGHKLGFGEIPIPELGPE